MGTTPAGAIQWVAADAEAIIPSIRQLNVSQLC